MTRADEHRSAEASIAPTGLLRAATLMLRRRGTLIGVPLLAALSALLFSLIAPKEFTVESRFLPETTQAGSARLQGLAAQFGFDIGGMDGGESVDFYAELLESSDLLRAAALTRYEFEHDGRSIAGTLPELLEIEGETPQEVLRNTIDVVGEQVVGRPDREAGIVTLRTSAPWPELTVRLNARLLDLINEFNLERRQSRAAAERAFLEQRVSEANADLTQAEEVLEEFLSENRRFGESPQLTFEQSRLQRRVDLLQQLYTSLAQGYEQARVDEVRNTPVVTVVDQPRPATVRQTRPRLLVNVALAFLLGLTLAVVVVLGGQVLSGLRRGAPAEFAELDRETRHALRRLVPAALLRGLNGRRRDADAADRPEAAGDPNRASTRVS